MPRDVAYLTRLSSLALALLVPWPLLAQGQAASAQAQYLEDLRACEQLSPLYDQEACRKEARHAFAEAQRGRLDDPKDLPYQRNAEARCNVFVGQERADCIDRLHAPTRTDGSVKEGGVLRERTTPAP